MFMRIYEIKNVWNKWEKNLFSVHIAKEHFSYWFGCSHISIHWS